MTSGMPTRTDGFKPRVSNYSLRPLLCLTPRLRSLTCHVPGLSMRLHIQHCKHANDRLTHQASLSPAHLSTTLHVTPWSSHNQQCLTTSTIMSRERDSEVAAAQPTLPHEDIRNRDQVVHISRSKILPRRWKVASTTSNLRQSIVIW